MISVALDCCVCCVCCWHAAVAGNTTERLFSCIVMVLGSCTYAYGITSVISSMSGINEYQRRITAQKDQLNRYMDTMAVPRVLRQKLREYFVHYQNAADVFNEHSVLQMLSPGLRSSLCSLANAPLLRKVSFFTEVRATIRRRTRERLLRVTALSRVTMAGRRVVRG